MLLILFCVSCCAVLWYAVLLQRHLPYRDSKLTRLLQPFLSGNSHMAIITTISPAAGSVDNTRAALHFATAAARVVMRPQLNRVASSKAVIKAMASEIQQLKAKLVSRGWMDGTWLCFSCAGGVCTALY